MRFLILFFLMIVVGTAQAYRIEAPPTITAPLTNEQAADVNKWLRKVWELTNGEFNLDIVSTTKSNSDNGDIWILTGTTAQIQIKSGDTIFTFSAD